MSGSINVHVGCMFAKKSTMAHDMIVDCVFRNEEATFIIPAMDTRYSKKSLSVSHDGSTMAAIRVENLSSVNVHDNVKTIVIDEAQFIPGLALFCIAQKQNGKKVHVFGLQSDKDGKAWPLISELIVVHHDQIDSVTHLYANCVVCRKSAAYNIKVSGDQAALIELGGEDMYAPVCLNHFLDQTKVTKDVLNQRKEDVKRVNKLKNSN